jgi:predicted GH43/DUF377 family glycosyl hydrolase
MSLNPSRSHPFNPERIGIVMAPEPGNPFEAEGVLNPAAVRHRDGQLYLFPRMVAKGNFSRIGIARVLFGDEGDPVGVERLGIALEPEADYERRPDGGGGCEDPRISWVQPLGLYVMTYTAYSAHGPRIALAVSSDLFHWDRLGLASFYPYEGIEFAGVDNKDAVVFPELIEDAEGRPSLAIIHRPYFQGSKVHEIAREPVPREVDLALESMWIAYAYCDHETLCSLQNLCHFKSHQRLASPAEEWERLKIGSGTPPVETAHGWMTIYHGVGNCRRHHQYSAGIMILDKERPGRIRYRSKDPLLTPELPEEKQGVVPQVVFPTGIDRRDDLDQPNRYDVYYGMADRQIGVFRIKVPETLPSEAQSDAAQGRL